MLQSRPRRATRDTQLGREALNAPRGPGKWRQRRIDTRTSTQQAHGTTRRPKILDVDNAELREERTPNTYTLHLYVHFARVSLSFLALPVVYTRVEAVSRPCGGMPFLPTTDLTT